MWYDQTQYHSKFCSHPKSMLLDAALSQRTQGLPDLYKVALSFSTTSSATWGLLYTALRGFWCLWMRCNPCVFARSPPRITFADNNDLHSTSIPESSASTFPGQNKARCSAHLHSSCMYLHCAHVHFYTGKLQSAWMPRLCTVTLLPPTPGIPAVISQEPRQSTKNKRMPFRMELKTKTKKPSWVS